MGKYRIWQEGNKWYVMCGVTCVTACDTKQEALEWIASQG